MNQFYAKIAIFCLPEIKKNNKKLINLRFNTALEHIELLFTFFKDNITQIFFVYCVCYYLMALNSMVQVYYWECLQHRYY